jgi:hypothetical protein
MRNSLAIAFAVLTFAACKPRLGESPAKSQDAIKALGSTVPATQFDRTFWQREHDANSSTWNEAKRLCGQTVLANYPNCLPVNDIVQVDQRKRAEEGKRAASKNDEMFRRGYQYDFVRKEWLPFREMDAAGCTTIYPSHLKPGSPTWHCPPGAVIPKGIPDPNFSSEGQ